MNKKQCIFCKFEHESDVEMEHHELWHKSRIRSGIEKENRFERVITW